MVRESGGAGVSWVYCNMFINNANERGRSVGGKRWCNLTARKMFKQAAH